MEAKDFDLLNIDITWCPGCGNFALLRILKETFAELRINPENLVVISGIGQSSKTPHYFKTNSFHTLHGRAIPIATAVKAVNPSLTVIAEGGDGDMYGEGGNHMIHAIRRNPDITNIIHNNMVYGLTKGQASPTTMMGTKTTLQVEGVILDPFNPIAVAIALNASFVARAFVGDIEQTKEILKKAINHKGYAIVDIFQQCPSFNKINTYEWFKKNTYYIDDKHDPYDRIEAFKRSIETEKLPLGIFYINNKKSFEENIGLYTDNKEPICFRERETNKIQEFIELNMR
ncbi:MAG: 2-oxoglutarate synthase subunit KorB [Candidatus Methanofastidiosum methylothiophilum]|jgi:2-oxoglutarate ferredoxin oxidoreductase subunit beta|nr:MAG: 2-oxoglutarate synthase subunit KorB [Candidatus Methanofastidiosum methylthiophilus]MBP6932180.1 2-oxoacid ferredoxin oxidoreductase [Methanofastidiosum sp.]OQC52317.1 MAG: 2-oxoglutarate synthase subunit KorB [Euryarchaeota archaeon ADurb.Bin023]HNV93451.1 thiamine pyrophosphate-dependent enzyme [Methanofastidiosum sp.]HNZ60695.1 thiamine pyrophosphate-dependent enzyme [Methanofastidiosum sp.]